MSIYLAYHYPCIDGAYSALIAFMALKSQLDNNNKDQKILFQKIENYLSTFQNKEISTQNP